MYNDHQNKVVKYVKRLYFPSLRDFEWVNGKFYSYTTTTSLYLSTNLTYQVRHRVVTPEN